jgi:enoyl-CoA hydratase
MPVTVREGSQSNIAHLELDFGPVNTFTSNKMRAVIDQLANVPSGTSVLTVSAAESDSRDSGLKGLSAGLDLKNVKEMSASEAYEALQAPYEMMQAIRNLDPVTVCCCGEYALGIGFEIALSCDFRIAVEDSKLGVPEVEVGLPTIIQGGLLIPYVGLQTAKEICYTGRIIPGREAEELDLINHAVPETEYEERIETVVEMLAEKSPSALRFQKQVFQMWRSNGLENGMENSVQVAALAFDTHDQKEGIEAALSDRDPEWEK